MLMKLAFLHGSDHKSVVAAQLPDNMIATNAKIVYINISFIIILLFILITGNDCFINLWFDFIYLHILHLYFVIMFGKSEISHLLQSRDAYPSSTDKIDEIRGHLKINVYAEEKNDRLFRPRYNVAEIAQGDSSTSEYENETEDSE